LAADFPNSQLRLYDWIPRRFAPSNEQLSAFHRVHRVKLFATLADDPARSRAILWGGRNIYDGCLFDHALGLSAFSAVNSRDEPGVSSLNYFATCHASKVALEGDAAVRTLPARLATFWHRDAVTSL